MGTFNGAFPSKKKSCFSKQEIHEKLVVLDEVITGTDMIFIFK